MFDSILVICHKFNYSTKYKTVKAAHMHKYAHTAITRGSKIFGVTPFLWPS